MGEIERIAASLTKAQREALDGCWQDGNRHAPYHVWRNTAANRAAWRSMLPLEFVTTEGGGFDLVIKRGRPIAMACLTPLGLAVRAHLQEASQP